MTQSQLSYVYEARQAPIRSFPQRRLCQAFAVCDRKTMVPKKQPCFRNLIKRAEISGRHVPFAVLLARSLFNQ